MHLEPIKLYLIHEQKEQCNAHNQSEHNIFINYRVKTEGNKSQFSSVVCFEKEKCHFLKNFWNYFDVINKNRNQMEEQLNIYFLHLLCKKQKLENQFLSFGIKNV